MVIFMTCKGNGNGIEIVFIWIFLNLESRFDSDYRILRYWIKKIFRFRILRQGRALKNLYCRTNIQYHIEFSLKMLVLDKGSFLTKKWPKNDKFWPADKIWISEISKIMKNFKFSKLGILNIDKLLTTAWHKSPK